MNIESICDAELVRVGLAEKPDALSSLCDRELARVGLATDYTDFAEFEKQHRKAYPKATDEEIEKAWKNYVAHMEKSKTD
jgi:hypothetical protein